MAVPKKPSKDDLLKSRTFQYQFALDDKATGPLDKMSAVLELMTRAFVQANRESRKLFTKIVKEMKGVSKALSSSIADVNKLKVAADKLEESTDKAGEAADNAADKYKNLKDVVSFDSVVDALQLLNDTDTGKVALGFQANLRKVGQQLGLAGQQTDLFRKKILNNMGAVDKWTTPLTQAGDSVAALQAAGMRSGEEIAKLTPVLTHLSANLPGLGAEAAAKSLYELTDSLGLTNDDALKLYNTMSVVSSKTATSIEDLQGTVDKAMEGVMLSYRGADEGFRTDVMRNMMTFQGAMNEFWSGGNALAEMMSGTLAGNMEQERALMKISGQSAEQLRESLKTSEGMADFAKNLLGNLKGLEELDPRAMQAMAGTLGVNAKELTSLIKNSDKIVGKLDNTAAAADMAGSSMGYLSDITKANTLFIERLGNYISHLAGVDIPLLGVSMDDIIDISSEIPVEKLVAWSKLGKDALNVYKESSDKVKGYAANLLDLKDAQGKVEFSYVGAWKALKEKLIPATVTAAYQQGGLTAALGAYKASLLTYIPASLSAAYATGGLTGAMGALATSVWAAISPLLPFVAVAAGLVAVGYLIYKAWRPVMAFLTDIGAIKFLGGLADNFLKLGKVLLTLGKMIFEYMIEPFKEVYRLLASIESKTGIFSTLAETVGASILEIIKIPVNQVFEALNGLLSFKLPFQDQTLGQRAGVEKFALLAKGGVVTGPTPAVVGEAGPEYIFPLPDFTSLVTRIAEAAAGGAVTRVETTREVIREGKATSNKDVVDAIHELMGAIQVLAPKKKSRAVQAAWAGSGYALNFGGE